MWQSSPATQQIGGGGSKHYGVCSGLIRVTFSAGWAKCFTKFFLSSACRCSMLNSAEGDAASQSPRYPACDIHCHLTDVCLWLVRDSVNLAERISIDPS